MHTPLAPPSAPKHPPSLFLVALITLRRPPLALAATAGALASASCQLLPGRAMKQQQQQQGVPRPCRSLDCCACCPTRRAAWRAGRCCPWNPPYGCTTPSSWHGTCSCWSSTAWVCHVAVLWLTSWALKACWLLLVGMAGVVSRGHCSACSLAATCNLPMHAPLLRPQAWACTTAPCLSYTTWRPCTSSWCRTASACTGQVRHAG